MKKRLFYFFCFLSLRERENRVLYFLFSVNVERERVMREFFPISFFSFSFSFSFAFFNVREKASSGCNVWSLDSTRFRKATVFFYPPFLA